MIERPLIFIPGIFASVLAIGGVPFWPPMTEDAIKKVIDNLSTNVRTRIEDKVPVVAIAQVGYEILISAIIGWGYTPDINFWTFPYDWRQSNEVSGKMLTKFIKDKNLDSVDIVCHSMGGFVARAAHIQGTAPIKRAVYIASPHFGNPMSYFELNPEIYIMVQGFTVVLDKLPIERELKDLIDGTLEKEWKDLYSKWPSAYELMPDDFYLEKNAMIFSDGKPILGTNETYLNNDWSLPQDMQAKVSNAMKFKKMLGEKLPESEDDILVIFANDLPTVDIINHFSNGVGFTNQFPLDSGQHGDTWVVTKSAMGSMSGLPVYTNSRPISDIHPNLPNNGLTIDEIRKFLNP
jgi:pimeloyl-ACP methyl ester carboxylesterase